MKDYYRILMVHPEADAIIIKVAYRRLAQEYHPDVCKFADANERMAEVNEAYKVVSDPVRRAEYDAHRSRGRVAVEQAAEPVPVSWRHIMAAERLLEDIEERSQKLSSDRGSVASRQFAATLYQECMNVLQHLERLTGDDIEREAIDYMRACAHLTAGLVTLNRPGFRDVSTLNFGSSTIGSMATLVAWGVGTSGSHAQEKQNLRQAHWHYETSLSIYELTPAHMMAAYCLLDLRDPPRAIHHFYRVIEIDPIGEAGIEASKELMRLGALSTQGQFGIVPPPAPVGFAPPGSISTPAGLLASAGFGLRMGASLIDGIICMFVYAVAFVLASVFPESSGYAVALFLAATFAYFVGMESSKYQGTVGKVVLGLSVCDMHGKRLGLGIALLKHTLRLMVHPCLGFIGWLVIAFSTKKQAVYEMIAGSVTVVGRPSLPK